jgi:hypothetical protein
LGLSLSTYRLGQLDSEEQLGAVVQHSLALQAADAHLTDFASLRSTCLAGH